MLMNCLYMDGLLMAHILGSSGKCDAISASVATLACFTAMIYLVCVQCRM